MNIILSVTIIFRWWLQKITETWKVRKDKTVDLTGSLCPLLCTGETEARESFSTFMCCAR